MEIIRPERVEIKLSKKEIEVLEHANSILQEIDENITMLQDEPTPVNIIINTEEYDTTELLDIFSDLKVNADIIEGYI